MTLEEYLGVGKTITLGSYKFSAEEIKNFAARYDPQPLHLNEEAAKKSVLGGLCASGWHTAVLWMRYNVAHRDSESSKQWRGTGPRPVFGPSPGIRDLKWLKPVYAGDTITYSRTVTSLRNHPRRRGWRMLILKAEAFNSEGEKVLEFSSSVLVGVDTSKAQ